MQFRQEENDLVGTVDDSSLQQFIAYLEERVLSAPNAKKYPFL